MSAGGETFVLARRGLPLAAPSRRSARAPWFASFAFPRPRVSTEPGTADEPLPEESVSFSEEALAAPEEALPDEALPIEERIRGQDRNHLPRTQRIITTLPPNSVRALIRDSTPEPSPTAGAPERTPAVALPSLPVEKASVHPVPDEPVRQTATEEPQEPQETAVRSAVRPAPRPVPNVPVPHHLSGKKPIAAKAAVPQREISQRPGASSLPRVQPLRAEAPTREIPALEANAPAAPQAVSMPMGKPPEPQPRDVTTHAAAAAARVTAQRLSELGRVARAASAPLSAALGAPRGTRIGTVEIVVRTPPPPQVVPRPPAAPAPAQAVRERRKEVPFRNPWASSRWRRGD